MSDTMNIFTDVDAPPRPRPLPMPAAFAAVAAELAGHLESFAWHRAQVVEALSRIPDGDADQLAADLADALERHVFHTPASATSTRGEPERAALLAWCKALAPLAVALREERVARETAAAERQAREAEAARERAERAAAQERDRLFAAKEAELAEFERWRAGRAVAAESASTPTSATEPTPAAGQPAAVAVAEPAPVAEQAGPATEAWDWS